MKKVVIGDEKGYLIGKEEFDKRLVDAFAFLKGKNILWIDLHGKTCVLGIDNSECEKNEGHYHKTEYRRQYEKILVPKEKLCKIFNISEPIHYVSLKQEREEGIFYKNDNRDIYEDQSKFYYFMRIKEEEIESMKEVEVF